MPETVCPFEAAAVDEQRERAVGHAGVRMHPATESAGAALVLRVRHAVPGSPKQFGFHMSRIGPPKPNESSVAIQRTEVDGRARGCRSSPLTPEPSSFLIA